MISTGRGGHQRISQGGLDLSSVNWPVPSGFRGFKQGGTGAKTVATYSFNVPGLYFIEVKAMGKYANGTATPNMHAYIFQGIVNVETTGITLQPIMDIDSAVFSVSGVLPPPIVEADVKTQCNCPVMLPTVTPALGTFSVLVTPPADQYKADSMYWMNMNLDSVSKPDFRKVTYFNI